MKIIKEYSQLTEMHTLTDEQMMQQPDVIAYLNELAADIAKHGGLEGKTMEQAIKEAHARRQAFAEEMAMCETRRAKMARKAIMASVFVEVNAQHYHEKQRQLVSDVKRSMNIEMEALAE